MWGYKFQSNSYAHNLYLHEWINKNRRRIWNTDDTKSKLRAWSILLPLIRHFVSLVSPFVPHIISLLSFPFYMRYVWCALSCYGTFARAHHERARAPAHSIRPFFVLPGPFFLRVTRSPFFGCERIVLRRPRIVESIAESFFAHFLRGRIQLLYVLYLSVME